MEREWIRPSDEFETDDEGWRSRKCKTKAESDLDPWSTHGIRTKE